MHEIQLWKDYLGPVIVNEMEFVDVNNDGFPEELALSMGFKFIFHLGRFVLYNATYDNVLGHGQIIWEAWNPFGPFRTFEVAEFNNDAANYLDFAVS